MRKEREMIKEKIIGMLFCIFILLLACTERDETDSLINSEIIGKDEVKVSLSLSSLPELEIEGNTNYRPMNTRAGNNIQSKIYNKYKCLVLKRIGEKWYVDSLLNRTLTNIYEAPYEDKTLDITKDFKFNDLQLTLRPGHYRLLVVLNSKAVKWNQNLIPGAVVKNEADTVTHAYTYALQTSIDHYINYNKIQLNREIFAGTAEFTVNKTSDLHSPSINGDTRIPLKRKVMQLRFMLKDCDINGINFRNTQHTVHTFLVPTDPKKPLCDGLDCWGDPYYNHKTPTMSMELITDLQDDWRIADNGEQYKIAAYRVTKFSPFVFSDNSTTIPFQMERIKVLGQAAPGEFTYEYPETITDLVLKDNSILQIMFQVTDKITESNNQWLVTLEYLKEESKNQNLFPSNYECNIP